MKDAIGHEVGERVGAILSANEEVVQFLGFGTYVGLEEPPVAPMGLPWERWDAVALEVWGKEEFERRRMEGILRPTNPKIELDNGKIVWGQECWWGSVAQVKMMMKDRLVINVNIDVVRSER